MGNPWVENYEEEKARTDRKLFFTLSPKKREALKQDFCARFRIDNDYKHLPNDGEQAQDIARMQSYKKFAQSGQLKQTIDALNPEPYKGDSF